MDNAPEETHVVFCHDPAFGHKCEDQRRKGQLSSPAPNSKAKTDSEKNQGNRSKLFRHEEQNPESNQKM